jgi:hypothetical protein
MIPVRADRLPHVISTFPQPGPALAGEYCPACGDTFDGPIALVYIGPGDDLESQEQARAGRWHTGMSVAVHAACAGVDA